LTPRHSYTTPAASHLWAEAGSGGGIGGALPRKRKRGWLGRGWEKEKIGEKPFAKIVTQEFILTRKDREDKRISFPPEKKHILLCNFKFLVSDC